MRYFVIIICVFLIGCTNETTSRTSDNITPSMDTIRASLNMKDARNMVDSFSASFQPDSSSYEGIGSLKNVPDSIIQAFKILRNGDTLSHRKYLTVIFLKLYLDHLRCCHQGYELRQNPSGSIDSIADPLLYEFNLSTKMLDSNAYHEFINSGIAYAYVEKHKELLIYPEVSMVMKKIKPVQDSIEKHLYWKP